MFLKQNLNLNSLLGNLFSGSGQDLNHKHGGKELKNDLTLIGPGNVVDKPSGGGVGVKMPPIYLENGLSYTLRI